MFNNNNKEITANEIAKKLIDLHKINEEDFLMHLRYWLDHKGLSQEKNMSWIKKSLENKDYHHAVILLHRILKNKGTRKFQRINGVLYKFTKDNHRIQARLLHYVLKYGNSLQMLVYQIDTFKYEKGYVRRRK